MATFKKGQKRPASAGRKKGTPNRATKELKDMILGALSDAGGQAYLVRQAKENPSAFLTLIGKVLPTTLQGTDGGPVRYIVELTAPQPNGSAHRD